MNLNLFLKLAITCVLNIGLGHSAINITYESEVHTITWSPITETEYYTDIDATNSTVAPYRIGLRVYSDEVIPAGGPDFASGREGNDPDGNHFSEFIWVPFDPLNPGKSAGLKYYNYDPTLDTAVLSPTDLQKAVIMLKTGACNEPDQRKDAAGITIEELKILLKDPAYYDTDYRYQGGDYMGKHGGEYAAGIFDSFYGETQFQFAKPRTGWVLNVTDVEFDENNGGTGPSIWMALSGNQEYYGTDLQVLVASGMKESWLFSTGSAIAVGMTPYHIECATYGDQIAGQYPSLYPFGLTCTDYLGAGSAYPTTDGPKAINAVMSAGFLWQSYYKQLNMEVDLAWKQVLENSIVGGDPLIGFCYMASMYNQGPGYEFVHAMLLPDAQGGNLSAILGNPQGCEELNDLLPNFGGYLNSLKKNAYLLSDISKLAETDPTVEIVERWITLEDLKMFWFGENGDYNTAAKSQDGGILLHYDMQTDERKAIWEKVEEAFQLQSAHWPAKGGKPVISLRYDWLSNLRIAKEDLNLEVEPSFASWRQKMIDKFSDNGVDANGQRIDNTYPFAKIQKPTLQGDFVFEVNTEDPFYVADDPKQQDRGIESVEWTSTENWTKWRSDGVKVVNNLNPRVVDNDTTYLQRIFEVTIPAAEVAEIQANGGATIYVRTTDLCGNSIVTETPIKGVVLPEITKAEMYDTDGDGKADSLSFEGIDKIAADGEKAIFKDFTSVSYSWNEKNFENVSVSGNYWVLDKTHDFGTTDPVSGKLTVSYNGSDISEDISDMVGPVAISASVKERKTNDAKDTLSVSFSRSISGVDEGNVVAFLEFFGKASGLGAPESILSVQAKNIKMIYPGKSIDSETDSLRIDPAGPLVAKTNNVSPHPSNMKIPIFLDKGPIPLAEGAAHGWFDRNGDGTMDEAVIYFGRDIDAGKLADMSFSMTWKNDANKVITFTKTGLDVSVDLSKVSVSFGDDDNIAPYMTELPTAAAGSPWGKMQVTQPGENDVPQVDDVPMQDKMGPVLKSATMRQTSNPQVNPDILTLEFSEVLEQSDAVKGEQFQFNMEGVERVVSYSDDVEWKNEGYRLSLLFEPEHELRPVIGDSVRILPGDLGGALVDVAKNTSHIENVYQLIDGRQIVKFFGPKLVSTPANSSAEAFDSILIFDKGENADSVIAEKGLMGIGFEFSFNDKDLSVENRDAWRLNVTIDVFDNLGQFVANKKLSLGCKNIRNAGVDRLTRLNQACNPELFANSRAMKLFVPWNMRSSAKETLVGTGMYILKATAGSARPGRTLLRSTEHSRTIGVLRNTNKAKVLLK